jgi:hypothetical protein
MYIETRIKRKSILLCQTQKKTRHGHYVSTTKERKHQEEEIFIQLKIVDKEIHLRNKQHKHPKWFKAAACAATTSMSFKASLCSWCVPMTALNPNLPSFTAHDYRPSN